MEVKVKSRLAVTIEQTNRDIFETGVISLDAPLLSPRDGTQVADLTVGDTLSYEDDSVEKDLLYDGIMKFLDKVLDERSRDMVKRYFGLKDGPAQTLQEIGQEYKMSRERVRQILKASLNKLRHSRYKNKYLFNPDEKY